MFSTKKVKLSLLIISLLICLSLIAKEEDFQTNSISNLKTFNQKSFKKPTNSRDIFYEFTTEPVDLIDNYHDYMPGSYTSLPFQYQPDEVGGGKYMVFHGMNTPDASLRVYFSHIAADGTITGPFTNSSIDIRESYPGMGIDPVTGDPLWNFQTDFNSDGFYDYCFGYDQFHIIQGPGVPAGPFLSLDNEELASNPLDYLSYDFNTVDEIGRDEFIRPNTYVGPSPEEGMRRVYVTSKNYSTGAAGTSENVLIGYADFDTEDLNGTNDLDWNYTSVEFFDDMHLNTTHERPFQSFTVGENGRVAFMGYRTGEAVDAEGMPLENSEFFVVYSNDYGNSWNVREENITMPVTCLPENEDGSPYIENLDESSICMNIGSSAYFNPIFDNDNNLQAGMLFNIIYKLEEQEGWLTFPTSQMVKNVKYDFDSDSFTVEDVFPANNNSSANNCPWDENADGEIDEFNEAGNPMLTASYPNIYWKSQDGNYDHSYQSLIRTIKNKENSTVAIVWQDSWKAYQYLKNENEEYAAYEEAPEIMVALSFDNGTNWEETARINSVETPEMDNIIPAFVYPINEIKNTSGFSTEISFMWLDDNTYGSSEVSDSPEDGGIMQYTTMKFYSTVTETYTVNGNVTNNADEAIENAIVNLGSFNDTTDDNGDFEIYPYEGTYDLTIDANGYELYTEEDIVVSTDKDLGNISLTKLGIPQNLTSFVENNEITLTWEAPESNDLTGFKVYRDNVEITELTDPNQLSFSETTAPGTYSYYITAIYDDKESFPSNTVEAVVVSNNGDINSTQLISNYPNPFKISKNNRDLGTNIMFAVKDDDTNVKIDIYNLKGQKVKTLTDRNYDLGNHSIQWNGLSDSGKTVNSGIYFYKMNAGEYLSVKKMLVIK